MTSNAVTDNYVLAIGGVFHWYRLSVTMCDYSHPDIVSGKHVRIFLHGLSNTALWFNRGYVFCRGYSEAVALAQAEYAFGDPLPYALEGMNL